MSYIVQTAMPVIKFIATSNEGDYRQKFRTYQTFSANSNDVSGQNLLSYNFQRSINTFSGNFTIKIKEDRDLEKINNRTSFFDRVRTLDIVTLQSDINSPIEFYGIITKISPAGSTNDNSITISGHGIEWLLEYMSISLDVTAMTWTGSYTGVEARNIQTKMTVNRGEGSAKIKNAIYDVYNSFKDTATSYKKLSNSEIFEIFEKYVGTDFLEENYTSTAEFKYPITNNLYSNSIITLYKFFKGLFPDKVYEFHGVVNDGKPKIRLREVPFWGTPLINKLQSSIKLNPSTITNYSFDYSIEEVYTAFYAYIEGSVCSPEFYNRLYATNQGTGTSVISDKIGKYGYKPLQASFVGFNTEFAEDENVINGITSSIIELNQNLKSAYENLDEMLSGTITVVDILDKEKPNVGEFINFMGGKFYLTGIDHSWQYGRSPMLTYHVERGGVYTRDGNFSVLRGITDKFAEIEK